MQLECNIVTKKSKAGNDYTVLSVVLSQSPKVTKDVFLTDAEIAILQLNS